jgi:hypothetical protein
VGASESVPGQPVADADIGYGMDRERTISEAGLSSPLPEPRTADGPLTGIWLSSYEYRSSGRGASYTGRHYVIVMQHGAVLTIRSVDASKSRLAINMNVNGRVATGTWTEQTEGDGYYRGAVYHGGLQLIESENSRALAGSWVGFGKEGEVNTGAWSLTLVDADIGDAAIERWNRAPDDYSRTGPAGQPHQRPGPGVSARGCGRSRPSSSTQCLRRVTHRPGQDYRTERSRPPSKPAWQSP